ncbi:RidA family protein [Flavobacterium sp.]|mgnify:CR=1 FL=1|uniref:RidA family protein n=1 Tax=Flavobacterium sp. TaxID=239 RepID=UPI002FDEFD55
MNLISKLQKLGLTLLEVSRPGGNYQSVNIRGNIAYVAIQFPILGEKYLFQGRLGEQITTEHGYEAMKYCALNVLSQIETKIGFDKVMGLNHIEAYYQSTTDWDDGPIVVNGASDLFQMVLEEKGTHSRTILGVAGLPRNFAVGLTCSFTLYPTDNL